MSTREIERRIGRLEELERQRVGGGDDAFLTELSDAQLVDLHLRLSCVEEGSRVGLWPEWMVRPDAAEMQAAHVRLNQPQVPGQPCAHLTTRELLVIVFIDNVGDGSAGGAPTAVVD